MSSDERGVDPQELAARADLWPVDIRPQRERLEMGYVPGSYPLPLEGDAERDASRLLAANTRRDPVVLVCLGGHRSGAALEALSVTYPLPLCHLEGGLLAWQAAGLPTCGVRPPDGVDADGTIEGFKRALRACFVAESIEVSLSKGTPADPMSWMSQALDDEGTTLAEADPAALSRVIDRLAATSRSLGAPLDKVAENVDRMRAALEGL